MRVLEALAESRRQEMARGSGGDKIWPYPVELEPPFTPFEPRSTRDVLRDPLVIPEPRRVALSGALRCVNVLLSPQDEYAPPLGQELLLALKTVSPVALEIAGHGGRVQLQVTAAGPDADTVANQLRAYYPHAQVEETTDLVAGAGGSLIGRSYRLRESHLFLIRTEGKHDPYISLGGVLSAVPESELALLQVLFAQVRHPWHRNILAVAGGSWDPTKSSFADLPDLPKLARSKVERPLFAVALRLAASNATLLDRLEGSLLTLFDSADNGFVAAGPAYPADAVLGRYTVAPGMLLNVQELAALAHVPDPSGFPKGALSVARRTAPAPSASRDAVVTLGVNPHRGAATSVGLSADQLARHCFISGFTGSGKSTLLKTMLVSLMQRGHGLAFLDYAGDTAEELLDLVPERRAQDVVYFNPGDRDYAPALNVLAGGKTDAELLASEVMVALKRLFTGRSEFGPRMEWILRQAVRTLLASPTEMTLRDIPKLLRDGQYRQHLLQTIPDPELKAFWQSHANFPATAIDPILNRLSTFLDRPTVRNIVAQSNLIDMREAMQEGRIVVCNLSKGLLGEEAAQVLGSLILSKLQLAAMARAEVAASDRKLFLVAVDEFANLGGEGQDTASIRSLLSEARKYGVALATATQYTAQLDRDVRAAVFGNVGTLICLRCGIEDATLLQRELGEFSADDLMNLGVGQAIVRMGQASSAFNLDIAAPSLAASSVKEQVIRQSRDAYCRSRASVEHLLWQESQRPTPDSRPNREPEGVQAGAEPWSPPDAQDAETDTEVSEEAKATPAQGTRKRSTQRHGHAAVGESGSEVVNDKTKAELLAGTPRNQSQHRYLQSLIKQIAEASGYRATIEAPTPDRQGKVDVGLERNGRRIACEIGFTTTNEHELANIQKCLQAGYDTVVLCSIQRKTLNKVRTLATERLAKAELEKVLFLEPEELYAYLEEEAARDASTEETVKGYKVKVQYQPLTAREKQERREAMAQVMAQALRRLKGRD